MKLFKKLDSYLLHHYPSIWVTRVHSFLPIGLALILLIYFGNLAIGWNPKSEIRYFESGILFMIIPVLVYLVYWFIFQSRYNVIKSGGKMSLGSEYLSFLLYGLVFFVALLFIIVIPASNIQKIKNAVSEAQVLQDEKALDEGDGIFYGSANFKVLNNGKIRVPVEEFGRYYDYEYEDQDTEEISRREALERLERFIEAYNRYAQLEIIASTEEILNDRIAAIDNGYYEDGYYVSDYNSDDYIENDFNIYESVWDINFKIHRIKRYHSRSDLLAMGSDSEWFWKISLAIIAWLSMIVWVFKQMNLRHFVFGFISLCLTPLVAGIVGVLIFEVFLRSYRNEENVALAIVTIVYVVILSIAIRGYQKAKLNQTAYVLTMYAHIVLPAFTIFVLLFLGEIFKYQYYNGTFTYRRPFGMSPENYENLVYWVSVGTGLISIALFKPLYAKYRSLPSKK